MGGAVQDFANHSGIQQDVFVSPEERRGESDVAGMGGSKGWLRGEEVTRTQPNQTSRWISLSHLLTHHLHHHHRTHWVDSSTNTGNVGFKLIFLSV